MNEEWRMKFAREAQSSFEFPHYNNIYTCINCLIVVQQFCFDHRKESELFSQLATVVIQLNIIRQNEFDPNNRVYIYICISQTKSEVNKFGNFCISLYDL